MQAYERRKETTFKWNINRRLLTDVFLVAGSFAAARALVFDAASPFALAYISAFLFKGAKFYFAALFATLGIFTTFRTDFSMKYLLAIVILCAANLIVSLKPKTSRDIASFSQALTAGVAVIISGFVLIIIRSEGIFTMLINVLEGGLIFALALVLTRGMACIMPNKKRGTMSNEEIISVLIMAGIIMVGIADVYIWQFSLRYFSVAVIVLLAAQSGGATVAATCGMLLGFLLNITGFEFIFMAALLGVAGFAAGAVRSMGRPQSFAAFIIVAFFAALYFDLELVGWSAALSVALAGAVFIALPKSFLSNIHVAVNPALNPSTEYIERIREQVLNRIYDIAGGYKKLSKTFEQRISDKSQQEIKEDKLISAAQKNVCASCHKFSACWDKNAENTWGYVSEIVQKADKRGKLYMEDAPIGFASECVYPADFMGHLGASLEIDRVGREWQQKVIEAKSTIHQQFAGLSSVMYEFAIEVDAILNVQKDAENRILREFAKQNVEVDNLIVIENTLGKYEVSLTRKGGRGQTKYAKHIAEVISHAIGRQMELANERFAGRTVHLSYYEKQKFYIHSGVAKTGKDYSNDSGDSFSLIQLRDGRLIAALSDGMGSGLRAKDGSEATIELLEELMEKGFKKDIAIKLINSALLLKSQDEFFSTLDICMIDLNNGLAEFMKIGASASYLLRDGKVEQIGSWTLPVGILDTVEIDTCERYLSHSDIVVMVTDGVADSVKDGQDDWLQDLLEELTIRNPQDIADYILEKGKRNYGRHITDDMTVLVLRILDRK
ncbi:MAG: stage II sporulation protein E [Defluviitaleaceae bacterium]|nr:stage II sporulation protein E [Defluviitaleaceae bacterium]